MVNQSAIYLTKPLGIKAQPLFLNQVVALNTRLSPKRLLSYCQKIEASQQRVRKKKWGARNLDVDILLYGNLSISTPDLSIPHKQMLLRDFVLVPLIDIAPEARLPNQVLLSSYLKPSGLTSFIKTQLKV